MEQAQDHFRDVQPDLKEERKMLLETWLDIELNHGDTQHINAVKAKLPIKVKKLVKTISDKNPETATQDGENPQSVIVVDGDNDAEMVQEGWQEQYDYLFPDDEKTGKGRQGKNLKLLEMAHKWKKKETV